MHPTHILESTKILKDTETCLIVSPKTDETFVYWAEFLGENEWTDEGKNGHRYLTLHHPYRFYVVGIKSKGEFVKRLLLVVGYDYGVYEEDFNFIHCVRFQEWFPKIWNILHDDLFGTEEEQLYFVEADSHDGFSVLMLMKNPSERVQMEAVIKKSFAINYVDIEKYPKVLELYKELKKLSLTWTDLRKSKSKKVQKILSNYLSNS